MAVASLIVLPSLLSEVHWPWFGTVEMRFAAEEVLPPTLDLIFTDAWIRRNVEPSGREECVIYRTSADPDLVAAHYRNRFHELDWALDYDNGLDPRQDSYDYLIKAVYDGTSVLLHADPTGGSPHPAVPTAGTAYTVQVCTLAAWSDIAKLLKAKPSNS